MNTTQTHPADCAICPISNVYKANMSHVVKYVYFNVATGKCFQNRAAVLADLNLSLLLKRNIFLVHPAAFSCAQ